MTPTGRMDLPMRLLMKELLPALNWPRIATLIGGFCTSSFSQASICRFRETMENLAQSPRTLFSNCCETSCTRLTESLLIAHDMKKLLQKSTGRSYQPYGRFVGR